MGQTMFGIVLTFTTPHQKKNPCIFNKRTLFAGVTAGAFYEPKTV